MNDKIRKAIDNYLFTLHPFNRRFGFTAVFDVEGDDLALLDDHALETLTDDVWLDCNTILYISLVSTRI